VKVELSRRGLDVRTRSGYITSGADAQPPSPTIRAIAALHQDPAPQAFPLYAEALHFPGAEGNGKVPIFVEVPADALGYAPDSEGGLRADLTLLVRVLDSEGRPQALLQQRYAPTARPGASDHVESLLFYPQLTLPPGRYTLDAVGYDAVGFVASVRTVVFDVPQATSGSLQLSSLVVAKGVRPLAPQEGEPNNPLAFDGALLQPNLGEAVHKSESAALGFFFVAYADGNDRASEATVEVWRGTARVRTQRLRLEPPESDGCVRQAGSVPLGSLAPDRYRLEVTMASATGPVRTATAFDLVE